MTQGPEFFNPVVVVLLVLLGWCFFSLFVLTFMRLALAIYSLFSLYNRDKSAREAKE